MDTPLELTFTNMDRTQELEALAHEKVEHLEKFFDHINSCHVYVKASHRRKKTGNLYGVHIDVRLPGGELFVSSEKGDAPAHEHPEVAMRDAFHAMERELKEWKDRVKGEVKLHEGPLQGKIVEIHHDEGYGQIIANDHRLIYFHRNSVVDGSFDVLKPRDAVELVVQTEESDIGPQASTVRLISSMKYKPS